MTLSKHTHTQANAHATSHTQTHTHTNTQTHTHTHLQQLDALHCNAQLHQVQAIAVVHSPTAPYVRRLAHSSISRARHIAKDAVEAQELAVPAKRRRTRLAFSQNVKRLAHGYVCKVARHVAKDAVEAQELAVPAIRKQHRIWAHL
jgi:hypothetical protein